MADSLMSDRVGPGPGSELPQRPTQQPPPPSSPPLEYKFTPDELRVLKQCNRESFFQRSLPLGTVLGVGTFLGVQSGYIRGHTRWGPVPKVILAATVGYFIGKFSYQTKCAEMIMQLENSPLGEMLRKRKQQGRGGFNESITMDPSYGANMPPLAGVGSQDVYSDIGPRHDLDTDRPYLPGLNEDNRPTPDSSFLEDDSLPPHPPSHTTTYEELRRRNREEFEQKRNKQMRSGAAPGEMPPISRPRSDYPQNASPGSAEKNKYGDSWDD